MKDIINRIAELRKNIETAKTTDVIEISVELIRIESLLKQLSIHDVSQQSELLNGFRQWLIDEKKNINIYQHLINEYLKTI